MNAESVRLFVFVSALTIFSILEFLTPYRKRKQARRDRWPAHFLMIALSTISLKILFSSGLIAFSIYAQKNSLGFFNIVVIKDVFKILISLLILDLAIYGQHVLSHKINFLWRFHQVHHSDLDLDTTSALRFHPLEIIASFFYKAIFILVFGIPTLAVIIFEIILNFMALFNHSNIHLPLKLERLLRSALVTPQMHIIHHSVNMSEANKNFGFNLSIWDRFFKTYQSHFKGSEEIGLQQRFNNLNLHKFLNLLVFPFTKHAASNSTSK